MRPRASPRHYPQGRISSRWRRPSTPEGAEELGQLFKVPLSQDKFFLEVHMKLRPVDFATDGIFVCGLAHYPKPIDESIAQAQAAAARAATVLSRKSIEVEGVVSSVDESLCRGCGKCVEVCPYGAPQLVEKAEGVQISTIQEALCKGCGACAVACPTGAASIRHFNDEEVLTMVDAALTTINKHKEDEMSADFEPRIIAFCCNWCAYAGADLAGVSRIQYPPNIRIIRVMCSGRVSPDFILKAFQKGADGVLVSG